MFCKLFYYECGDGDMFRVVEICDCQVLVNLLTFSLLIDQTMNQNCLQHTHRNDETNELYNNVNLRIDTALIYSSRSLFYTHLNWVVVKSFPHIC